MKFDAKKKNYEYKLCSINKKEAFISKYHKNNLRRRRKRIGGGN